MDGIMADDKLIEEIRDRMTEELSNNSEANDEMLEDLLFLEGKNHWDNVIKNDRLADGRPCLTINKMPTFADQVTGDLRLNLPSIKIKPMDSGADPDTAEVMTGMIRNIQSQSNGDIAVLTASDSAVQCGKGSYRVITEYENDKSFNQIIRLKRIKNPFTVIWDSGAQEWDKSDAKFCFVTEKVPRKEFIKEYPEASIQEFSGQRDKNLDWSDTDTIRVAEYFRRTTVKSKLYEIKPLDGGPSAISKEPLSEADQEYWEVVNTRELETHKIEWYKTNGREILEGPTVWPGKYIPVIDVTGKELNIEGRTIYRGVVRNAKDSQRLYNYSRSTHAEVTALAPKIPVFVTAKMIGNNTAQWQNMHKKNYPYIVFEADEKAPQGPQRPPPAHGNPAAMSEIQIADQELHDTTGLQLASMGKQSNEKSGKAITARKDEGDRGNIEYHNNVGRARRWEGKILVDLIPKIYDTERVVRILGEDGSDDQVTINGPQIDEQTGQPKVDPKTQQPKPVINLSLGTYDAVVSVGPSYETQREEAADGMIALFGALPPEAQMIIVDLLVNNLDWPGSDEIAERLKTLLPPGLADPDGPPPPPPPPDPIQELEMEKMKAEVAKVLIEHQVTQAKVEGLLIENRIKRDEAAEKEIRPDDLDTRKTEAEITKLLADAKNANTPAPSKSGD
jgi:hypothetical protein